MFDSYCLSTTDLLTPVDRLTELREMNMFVTRSPIKYGEKQSEIKEVRQLVKNVFNGFGVKISRRHRSGRIYKSKNGVDISLIRQCVSHYCRLTFAAVSTIELGEVLGIDHSSVCVAYKKALKLLSVNDKKMLEYYKRFLEIVENPVQ